VAQLNVFNNTNANATVCAWLDFNGNGLFDASEAANPITVPSSGSTQSVFLNWPSTPSSLPNGSYTYLRIRITDQASGMTINNSTGYYDMGEVEDYMVVVDYGPLAVNLISFDASVNNNSAVKLKWSASEDEDFPGYHVERSNNGTEWESIGFLPASNSGATNHYELTDNNPYKGTSYYRLKFDETAKQSSYSHIETTRITDLSNSVTVFPNPAVHRASILINSDVNNSPAQIRIFDTRGREVSSQKIMLTRGTNTIDLGLRQDWPPGMYVVQLTTGDELVNKKLVLRK